MPRGVDDTKPVLTVIDYIALTEIGHREGGDIDIEITAKGVAVIALTYGCSIDMPSIDLTSELTYEIRCTTDMIEVTMGEKNLL